jgi:hypothetical protein
MYRIFTPVFANSIDAYIPEVWAAEALMVLHKTLVISKLVHTDFADEIASEGDVINTRRPAKFVSKRKVVGDNVSDQNATATNVAIPLDQHQHVSFVIKDGEESKGMGSLIATYLEPAVKAIGLGLDEAVMGEKYNFLPNIVGQLGTAPTASTLISAGVKMDENLAPPDGRNLVVSPATQGDLLNIASFTDAEKVGDDGSAMREGSLGRKYGLNTFMSQVNSTIAATTVTTGTLSAAEAAGQTTLSITGFSTILLAGSWLTVAGDMTPQLVTTDTTTAVPTEVIVSPGLVTACASGAAVTAYTPAYATEAITVANGSNETTLDNGSGAAIAAAPKIGQLFSTTGGTVTLAAIEKYGLMSTPTTTTALTNRALDTAVVDNDIFGLGPAGNYGFAFHRNAIALVSRPLAMPIEGTGARSFVAQADGIAVRVTISYDGLAQGTRVTVDVLCGVKTLDTNLGCVVLG